MPLHWCDTGVRLPDLARRGTLPYMAPELVSDPDHVSEKADVWSLGMVLWEMLALRTPFQHLAPQQIIAGARPSSRTCLFLPLAADAALHGPDSHCMVLLG